VLFTYRQSWPNLPSGHPSLATRLSCGTGSVYGIISGWCAFSSHLESVREMAELTSILTRVARWLNLKRREGVTVAASIFHGYLLKIDAPDDTVERCESMGWITYEPRRGYSSCKSDFSGNIYPGPIRWTEANYVIGSGIEAGTESAATSPTVGPDPGNGDSNSHTDADGPLQQIKPTSFRGGILDFFDDRVEFCGVDICSGSRSRSRRQILDLLRMRSRDDSFISYSGDSLGELLNPRVSSGTVSGAIRDLRNDIVERLRIDLNIICGSQDVVLSGGPGYRLAECITVHLAGQPIAEADEVLNVPKDVPNVPDLGTGDVPDVSDNSAQSRREWILRRLGEGGKLQGAAVAKEFNCSLKTAKRDLGQLKADGKIEFIGPARTGFYQLSKREK